MAADVMQGCRPGSAQLLGGLGSRLRSGVLSLSLFTLRVARFLFLFCFRARGAYRPAATRAQKFCKQVSFFRPVFACAHLFVSRFLVCPTHPLRVPLRECSEGCVIARIVSRPFRFVLNALYCKRTRTILHAWRLTLCKGVGPAVHSY